MPPMYPTDHDRLLVEVLERDLEAHGTWALLCIPGIRPLLAAWYKDDVQTLWHRSQTLPGHTPRPYPCVEESLGGHP